MAGRTVLVGEISGFTGETAIERGTGEDESGVDPVGVVLPLFGYKTISENLSHPHPPLYGPPIVIKCNQVLFLQSVKCMDETAQLSCTYNAVVKVKPILCLAIQWEMVPNGQTL